MDKKIRSFTDLTAWRKGHELVLEIYKLTLILPKEERYGLIDQMRRAVISITSNIAEGFSRNSFKEKIQFYSTALGSLTEIQNQLIVTKDIYSLDKNLFSGLAQKTIIVSKKVQKLKSIILNS